MGGGHGTYVPAMVIFPLGLLNTIFSDHLSVPFIILGIIQFPFYGFILDKASQTQKSKLVAPILITMHIILAVLIIYLKSENWR